MTAWCIVFLTGLRWGSIRNLSRPAQKLVQQLTVERESIEVLDTIRKGIHTMADILL